MTRKPILLVCLLGLAFQASASQKYNFRDYTTGDGLVSNTVRALHQSEDGLIWIGASDGLCTFDGREFMPQSFAPAGADNYINILFEDSEGTLWIGTDEAIYAGDKIFNINTIVSNITEDKAGNIWISTRGKGIIRYSKTDGKLNYYDDIDTNYEYVFVDSYDMVWACPTFAGGLVVYNRISGRFQHSGARYQDCEAQRFEHILEDGNLNLIIGSWDDGVYKYDRQSQTTRRVVTSGKGKGLNHIHSMLEISPGTVLVSSDEGLARCEINSGDCELVSDKEFVYPILKDREGGIWIGLYYGGISYCPPNVGQFENFGESDGQFVVSSFCDTGDGRIWVGSDNKGLSVWNTATGRLEERHLQNRNVHALLKDGRYLWVGSYTNGLDRFDTVSGEAKPYPGPGSIYSLVRDSDGTIWAGSMGAIFRYDREADSFVFVIDTFETVYSSTMDDEGTLWFATSGKGIFSYDRKKVWKVWTRANSGLPGNDVYSLAVSADGRLWAATKEGLAYLERGASRFNVADIEGRRNIFFVASDETGIWFTSAKELVRYIPGKGVEDVFSTADGLSCNQFLPNSGALGSDGKIYIGSARGFSSFYPRRIHENKVEPPVLITRVRMHERTKKASGNSAEYKSLSPWEHNTFSHKQNNVTITFAALSFCSPAKNSYEYQLEGFDRRWRKLEGDEPRAEYTNLPAGRYRFVVRAANNDGVWNREGASTSFTIKPHPLRSTVAIIIYILIVLASMVYLAFYLRGKIEEKSREKFDSYVKEYEREEKIRRNNDFAERLKAIIQREIPNAEFSADQLANELCVSRSGLFAKAKEITGLSPHQMMLNARLEESLKLIESGKHSLTDISIMTGFNSTSYFSKSFTKKYGVSPYDWKKI